MGALMSPERPVGVGNVVTRAEYHKLDDKLKILLRKFVPAFDFKSEIWSNVMEFKNFRDSLVHPRQSEDEMSLSEYQTKVQRELSGILEIMNQVSLGLFKKPLRKQLLDLMPD